MIPEEIIDRGREEDSTLESKRARFVVLLLGYGYPESALDLRRRASEALKGRGYNIFIMRDVEGRPNEKLNDKFRRILQDYNPQLFLILINQELGATGVSYEVSLLVERHGAKKASKMIRICTGKRINLGISFNKYITELDEIVIRRYEDDNFTDMIEVMENTIIDAMTTN